MDTPQLIVLETEHQTIRSLKRRLNSIAYIICGVADLGKVAEEKDEQIEPFRTRFSRADSKFEQFEAMWINLDDLYVKAKEDSKFPTQQDREFYQAISDEMLEATVSLNRLNKREGPATNKQDVSVHSLDRTMGSPRAHLPRISIPTFEGDLVKWSNFKDTYVSLIHDDPHISNIEKFNYLRNALKGEAATHITKLSVTSDTYELAWQSISEAYDNPRVLAGHYLKTVLDFSFSGAKPSLDSYQKYLIGVVDNIDAFKQLKVKNSTDFLLAFLALRSLDNETRREFELLHLKTEFPRTEDLFAFIRNRIKVYRLSSEDKSTSSHSSNFNTPKPNHQKGGQFSPNRGAKKFASFHTAKTNTGLRPVINSNFASSAKPNKFNSYSRHPCLACQSLHTLNSCFKFKNLTVEQRFQLLKAWKGCYNCLHEGHQVKECSSKYSCGLCGKKHHSLLHRDVSESKPETTTSAASGNRSSFYSTNLSLPVNRQVLLGTARVTVKSPGGKILIARALLDSCSEYAIVTDKLARRLGCKISAFNEGLTGLGEVPLNPPTGMISCTVAGQEKEFPINAAVVKGISAASPSSNVPLDIIKEMSNHDLADDSFGQPLGVDMLIGADIYYALLTGTPVLTKFPGLFLVPTIFGQVVSGKTGKPGSSTFHTLSTFTHREIDESLKRFWELEEPISISHVNPQDTYCENHFVKTHYRTDTGRYVVKLPVSSESPPCGNNRSVAEKRFYNLEKRLQGDQSLREAYIKFMTEYQELGHMTITHSPSDYIIPHHGIWKGDFPQRKLRVVFDASCPSKSYFSNRSISLNDTLLSGPKLQLDIADILTRFRLYQVALTCDMVKMYRQILVHPSQRKMQHIFWRSHHSLPLKEFELNTLTYGEKPCAFLAIRTILQLTKDEESKFPLAACRVRDSTYVDDFVSGTDTLEEAQALQKELVGMFDMAGFQLDKWSSNIASLLPSDFQDNSPLVFEDEDSPSTKILGLVWNPSSDTFSYSVTSPACTATKRSILSAIARIFDPLGFLTPVIFVAKILMQDLWIEKVGWDDSLPISLAGRWENLSLEWDSLSLISISRIIAWPGAEKTLIGFCDASQQGYSAVIYLRSKVSGKTMSCLVKAKSKVAPTKFTSIARLELCGAWLLARLFKSLNIPGCDISHCYCFTDSEVALSWIRSPTYNLKTFEANRVTALLEVVPVSAWRHVRSEDNPADVASRGCSPSQLRLHHLWWAGPSWLLSPIAEWPIRQPEISSPPEEATHAALVTRPTPASHKDLYEWMDTISSLNKLVRTMVVILRFGGRLNQKSGPINADEYSRGLMKCIYVCQRHTLPKEMFSQKPSSFLKELAPFLDQDGIVRVGGRLPSAPIPLGQKHPVIIPKGTHLSKVIVNDIHVKNFHAGPSLTLSLLRNKFWIPGGLRYVKGQILKCVNCRKRSPRPIQPLMGNLPQERLAQFRAFVNCGVDYAGPFLLKESTRRKVNRKPEFLQKAYLCVFICLASRAIHLECVTSLSTVAFLAALDRFVSRRGTPNTMSSDNGTNFVGASNYLKELQDFLKVQEAAIHEFTAPKGITWKFIPPFSPAFGGGWEAGVKSVKKLLVHSVGGQPFTYEELNTIFVQIEGLLNSRPLCPLSEDPENWDILTPGHFLIGAPLHTIPDTVAIDTSCHRTRWEFIGQQIKHVWNRWRQDYLHHLQQRAKWNKEVPNPRVGDLMIMIHKDTPTGRWPLARIVATHPGSDSVVRVVSVRVPSGSIFKRSMATLAPLFPLES